MTREDNNEIDSVNSFIKNTHIVDYTEYKILIKLVISELINIVKVREYLCYTQVCTTAN